MATIGTVREIKDNEYRVGLVPGGAKALVGDNHAVLVEKGAGLGSGISDEEYRAAGAVILPTSDDVWARADIIIKVKEPIAAEFKRLREGQILFTYLHLAPLPELTCVLLERKVTGVATRPSPSPTGRFPCSRP
jgi:alanine dehydrogenase